MEHIAFIIVATYYMLILVPPLSSGFCSFSCGDIRGFAECFDQVYPHGAGSLPVRTKFGFSEFEGNDSGSVGSSFSDYASKFHWDLREGASVEGHFMLRRGQ